MNKSSLIVAGASLGVVVVFAVSVFIVAFYPGTPISKHLGGIVNIGFSVGSVMLLSLCDPRWSLYEEIIEEQNISAAIVFGMFVVGAAIATPSSIL